MGARIAPGAGGLPAPRKWSASTDKDGNRTYKIEFQVLVDSVLDGPAVARTADGLPAEGDFWAYGNDVDPWAFRTPEDDVRPSVEGEGNLSFFVSYTFSTKSQTSTGRGCNEVQIEDPLAQPPKLSGSFVRFQEEATVDRFGNPTTTSSHEQIRGPQNEWDSSRQTIEIEMNVPFLDLDVLAYVNDSVNEYPMWDLSRRCIKCTVQGWDQKYFGVCEKYYTVKLSFEFKRDGWDRNLLDEGTKVLYGHWERSGSGTDDPLFYVVDEDMDPSNPKHFMRAKDANGENIKVPLNGAGAPVGAHESGDITDVVILGEGTGSDPTDDGLAIRSNGHGLSTGATVSITGVLGITEANGTWKITVLDANYFKIDVVTKHLYAGGGTWRELPGNVHVEKYFGVDLQLVLGLPSFL